LRKRQEILLEALVKKVEGLEGLVAKMSAPVSIAPTITAVSAAPANTVPVTDGGGREERQAGRCPL